MPLTNDFASTMFYLTLSLLPVTLQTVVNLENVGLRRYNLCPPDAKIKDPPVHFANESAVSINHIYLTVCLTRGSPLPGVQSAWFLRKPSASLGHVAQRPRKLARCPQGEVGG